MNVQAVISTHARSQCQPSGVRVKPGMMGGKKSKPLYLSSRARIGTMALVRTTITQEPVMAEPKADQKIPLTADDAVKLFAKQTITVNVVKSAKGGGAVRDPATGEYATEDVPLAAAHIIGIKERGGEVGITTADGRKYVQAAK